jgi:CRP/FNR family transcriptional regulator
MQIDPIDALKRVSFFRGLNVEALRAVAERTVRRRISAGTILFQRGEPCRGLYILLDGGVEIYRSTSSGREQVLHTERPVQSVAELPLFDGGEYPASARTTEQSTLLFLTQDDFQRLYIQHPEIATALIQNLGTRLRKMVRLIEKISLKDVPSRVAASLLDFAEASGPLADGMSFELPRTQTQLAHELATSRESVARALAALRKEGVIDQEGREITLLSVNRLEGLAHVDPPPSSPIPGR